MAIIVDEASEDQTPSSSSSARNDEVVGVAKDSARRRTHNKARGRTSTHDTNSPSPMLLLLQQTRDRHRHHHHHHNNATSLRTFSGKRHVRTLVNPNSSPSRASGSSINGGAVLRYRTDLDKEVIHFMFERHAAAHASHRVEELVVDGTAERDGAATGEWNFFWMSVGRLRTLMANADYRLGEYQIINHFPHHYELTRKDLMYKNIKRYLRECQQQRRSLTLITAREWATASALASVMQSGGAASPTDDVMDRPHVRFGNDDVDVDGSATPRDGNSRDALRGDGYQRFSFADAVPTTFNIPNDMGMFMEEFKRRPGATWIVKPTSRSQGKGIFLINKLPQLLRWVKEKKEVESMTYNGTLHLPTTGATSGAAATTTSSSSANASSGAPLSSAAAHNMLGLFIVSRYITNPLLIGGKKFDLRLYCLVTSYKPLVAYLHRDGFARFCATKYAGNHCLSEEDLGSHLTNVALQKGDAHYNDLHGGKWSLQNLFLYVQARYGPYAAESMMMKIEFLLFHSLRAMEPVIFNDRHACELYGFDVLIGDQLEPYLIEVNASPSLSTTTTSDRLMKEQVLSDMLKIVLPPGFPNAKSMPYGDYRLRVDLTTQLNTGFKLLHFPSK